MSFVDTLEIEDFSGGWIPDLPEESLPKNAATVLENADVRNRALSVMPGATEVFTDLPASVLIKSFIQATFGVPSEQNVTLLHGTLSGTHKLYVKPYLSSAGAWVDSWLDLTEAERDMTADATTSTTAIVDAALASSVDDYYNGWIVHNATRTASAIVTDYVGSTKTLTLSWAIASQAAGDTYHLMRNPVWDTNGNYLFVPTECRYLQRVNAIEIVTGGNKDYTISPYSTDLILTIQNGYQAFDDTDLNFTGFYLTRKHCDMIPSADSEITLNFDTKTADETGLPQPKYYGIMLVPVYDGFQIGRKDQFVYGIIGIASADRVIVLDVSIRYGFTSALPVSLALPNKDIKYQGTTSSAWGGSPPQPTENFLIFDRRITGIEVYICDTQSGIFDPKYLFVDWFYVKTLEVNDTAWSGTGITYTQQIRIDGDDYANATQSYQTRAAHSSENIHANASFIESVAGKAFYADVFLDIRRIDFVQFSPNRFDELNMPDVIPHVNNVNATLYGIPKIIGISDGGTSLIVYGTNRIFELNVDSLVATSSYVERGPVSANGIISINGINYFAARDDIYAYFPSGGNRFGAVKSLARGYLRETWRAITESDREAAALGYDARYNMLVIAAGSTIYLYALPDASVSELGIDTQAAGIWKSYSVSKTFTRFATTLDGACVGIASDGSAYELFATGAANTLVYESPVIQGPLKIDVARLVYNATANVTLKLFDIDRSETYPVRQYRFRAQSKHTWRDEYRGAQIDRLKLRLEATAGATISKLVLNPKKLDSE